MSAALAAFSVHAAASVTTLDGNHYDGQAFLEPGNLVSVVLPDSSKRSFPLHRVKTATFGTEQFNMASFAPISHPWTNSDVGDVTISGLAGQSNRLFAARIGSGDIGDRADSFHYLHTAASGSADLVARIVSIDGGDRLARAGLMFRDSLRPDAKFGFAAIAATGETAFECRSASGSRAARPSQPVRLNLPCWLRISRRAKTITASYSFDGRDWQPLGVTSIGLKDNCLVGLAAASHSPLSFCTALIDEVTRTVPGVYGEYFADADFTRLVTNRIDPRVNFTWNNTPVEGAPAENYAVRWTGEFEPRYSDNYTFLADPGDARLWVNGEELSLALFRSNLSAGRKTDAGNSAPLLLKAGNRYPFRFEFRHTTGRASVRLGWSSQRQPKEPIQAQHLFCQLEARAPTEGASSARPNPWTMARGALLRSGTFLAGAIRSITSEGIKFVHRGEKEYTLPVHQVARAVFRTSPRNALLSNPDLSPGALLGNGDFIEGRLEFNRGRDVKVSSVLFGMKSYEFDSSHLAALVFGSPSSAGARYQIRLADGSIVMANSVSVTQDHVNVVEPLIGALQMPRDAVTELRGFATTARNTK